MIKEGVLKANIQGILAIIVILGGFYILAFKDSDSGDKLAVVGLMGIVLGYYFGSSKGAIEKDKIITNLTKKDGSN